jgi:RNA polymerase sigma factor (sigma-70 family)
MSPHPRPLLSHWERSPAGRVKDDLPGARLPDDFREVIVLRNVEELPHEEVARRMGRSPGAVRMLWVRALARLRQELDSLSGT